jgi:ribosomal protein S18 acetylase RimI-like enzyme
MEVAELRIRSYAEADRAAVVELWREVFAGDPLLNEPEAMIRRKLAVQPELFLVGEVAGKIIATVVAGYDGVRGWIHHLAVARSLRRSGIATQLMREAESALAKLGCPKINLQLRPANAEVISFYRSLGYEIEERVSMGKRLDRQ